MILALVAKNKSCHLWSRKRNFHSRLCLDVNSLFDTSTSDISTMSCGVWSRALATKTNLRGKKMFVICTKARGKLGTRFYPLYWAKASPKDELPLLSSPHDDEIREAVETIIPWPYIDYNVNTGNNVQAYHPDFLECGNNPKKRLIHNWVLHRRRSYFPSVNDRSSWDDFLEIDEK